MPRVADRPDVLTFGAWICVGHEISPGKEDPSRIERGKRLLEALDGPQVTFPGLEQLGEREGARPCVASHFNVGVVEELTRGGAPGICLASKSRTAPRPAVRRGDPTAPVSRTSVLFSSGLASCAT